METRTELILLQRTMVVVEGVARSLDPAINMWEAAKPVVEAYIRDNLGPRAVLNDLTQTVRVLSRLGPRLPAMAEDLLIRANERPERDHGAGPDRWLWGLAGMVIGAAAVGLGLMF